jgi:hypothetical protein
MIKPEPSDCDSCLRGIWGAKRRKKFVERVVFGNIGEALHVLNDLRGADIDYRRTLLFHRIGEIRQSFALD